MKFKNIAVPMLLASAFSGSVQAEVFEPTTASGENCPNGFEHLSAADVSTDKSKYCGLLSKWAITRLTDSGVMTGSGYGCTLYSDIAWTVGESLCKIENGKTDWFTFSKMKSASVSSSGELWATDKYDKIWTKKNTSDKSWSRVSGRLRKLSVNDSGHVWGITTNGSIYKRTAHDSSWEWMGSEYKDVAVDNTGKAWAITDNNYIETIAVGESSWSSVGGRLSQIGVASNGRVWGINSNDSIYTRSATDSSWQWVSGKLRHIDVANNGRVWGVSAGGGIYTRTTVNGSWSYIAGGVTSIITAGNNFIVAKVPSTVHWSETKVYHVSEGSENSQPYREHVVHFADEHDPDNRLLVVDYESMKLLDAIDIEGVTNHHADVIGFEGDANYQMLIPKGSTFVQVRKVISGSYVKQIRLPFRPRSGDAFNPTHNLLMLNSRDRAAAVLIDTVKLKIVARAGFNIPCIGAHADKDLYESDETINIKCSTTDFGGDQISGHPIWLNDKLFALIDRGNRLIHVYEVTFDSAGNVTGTQLNKTIQTDTSLHQLIPSNKSATVFFGMTEGSNPAVSTQASKAGIYKFELNSAGTRLNKVDFKRLAIDSDDTRIKGINGHNLYLTPDQKWIYAPAGGVYHNDSSTIHTGGIFVLDIDTLDIVKFIESGVGAGHVTFSEQKGIAMVTNHKSRNVTAIDYTDNTFIKQVALTSANAGIFGLNQSHASFINEEGTYYYDFWADGGVFFRIDLSSLTVDATVEVGGIPIQGNYYRSIAQNHMIEEVSGGDGFNDQFDWVSDGWDSISDFSSRRRSLGGDFQPSNGYDK